MQGRPVMMVDPDGEMAFLAIAAIIGKAAAVGAGMGAASYALGTAMTGQNWDWGQFAGQVGKGAALGGLTAGAGLGFSAGLNAMGMGVQASNFMGGTLGSFSGSFLVGGLPQGPMGWASAGAGAFVAGSAMLAANPLGLSVEQPPLVDMLRPLPEVVVRAKWKCFLEQKHFSFSRR